jgi:hypothetical protein
MHCLVDDMPLSRVKNCEDTPRKKKAASFSKIVSKLKSKEVRSREKLPINMATSLTYGANPYTFIHPT